MHTSHVHPFFISVLQPTCKIVPLENEYIQVVRLALPGSENNRGFQNHNLKTIKFISELLLLWASSHSLERAFILVKDQNLVYMLKLCKKVNPSTLLQKVFT